MIEFREELPKTQVGKVLRLAKKLGMRTSIGTIGTMLARPDFAAKALPFLDEALFSIHGPDAGVHDAVARREGSFDTVTTAFRASAPQLDAFANTVLCQANVRQLPETVAMLDAMGAKLIVVSNTTPEGAACEPELDIDPDEACESAASDASEIEPNLYFLLDTSGSMAWDACEYDASTCNCTSGDCNWTAAGYVPSRERAWVPVSGNG